MKLQAIIISCCVLLSTARYTRYRQRYQKPAEKPAEKQEEEIPTKIESVDDGLSFLNKMWEKHGEKHSENAQANIVGLYNDLVKISSNNRRTEDQKYALSKNKLINFAKKNFNMDQKEAETFFVENEEKIRAFMATVDVEKTSELLSKIQKMNIKTEAGKLTDLIENQDAKKAADDLLKVINKNVDLDKSVEKVVEDVSSQLWSFFGAKITELTEDLNSEDKKQQ